MFLDIAVVYFRGCLRRNLSKYTKRYKRIQIYDTDLAIVHLRSTQSHTRIQLSRKQRVEMENNSHSDNNLAKFLAHATYNPT